MFDKSQIRYNLAKTPLRAPFVWHRHRHLHASDVFIASYPRSGSTWLRFLLFNLISGIEADFSSIQLQIPGVENRSKARPLLPEAGRLLQTHEFYRPEYRKAIYLIRDVRDVMISEYYFLLRKGVFKGDFNSFFMRFLYGKVNPYGFWGSHVESWLDSAAANKGKVLLIRYEEMRLNTEAVLSDIMVFLGIKRTIESIREAIEDNTIESMRKKESQAPQGTFKANRTEIRFIRHGSSGGWQDSLTNEQLKSINERLGKTLDRLGYTLQTN